MKYVMLMLIVGCLCGCASMSLKDIYPYQPLSNEKMEVQGVISDVPEKGIDWAGKSQYITKIKWKTGGFKLIDSERVINICTEYLDGISYHFKLDDKDCPPDNRYYSIPSLK